MTTPIDPIRFGRSNEANIRRKEKRVGRAVEPLQKATQDYNNAAARVQHADNVAVEHELARRDSQYFSRERGLERKLSGKGTSTSSSGQDGIYGDFCRQSRRATQMRGELKQQLEQTREWRSDAARAQVEAAGAFLTYTRENFDDAQQQLQRLLTQIATRARRGSQAAPAVNNQTTTGQGNNQGTQQPPTNNQATTGQGNNQQPSPNQVANQEQPTPNSNQSSEILTPNLKSAFNLLNLPYQTTIPNDQKPALISMLQTELSKLIGKIDPNEVRVGQYAVRKFLKSRQELIADLGDSRLTAMCQRIIRTLTPPKPADPPKTTPEPRPTNDQSPPSDGATSSTHQNGGYPQDYPPLPAEETAVTRPPSKPAIIPQAETPPEKK